MNAHRNGVKAQFIDKVVCETLPVHQQAPNAELQVAYSRIAVSSEQLLSVPDDLCPDC